MLAKGLIHLGVSVLSLSALCFASGANANPGGPDNSLAPIGVDALPEAPAGRPGALEAPPGRTGWMALAHLDASRHFLAVGAAPEAGMQVKTILVERAVSEVFPQIHTMTGVRPDAKPWHPNGLAVDIMIPDSDSPEGIALGDAIRDYALSNVEDFGIQDVIWRGVYYTPAGPTASGYGHFDHVHITTTGGGYPLGDEVYLAPAVPESIPPDVPEPIAPEVPEPIAPLPADDQP